MSEQDDAGALRASESDANDNVSRREVGHAVLPCEWTIELAEQVESPLMWEVDVGPQTPPLFEVEVEPAAPPEFGLDVEIDGPPDMEMSIDTQPAP